MLCDPFIKNKGVRQRALGEPWWVPPARDRAWFSVAAPISMSRVSRWVNSAIAALARAPVAYQNGCVHPCRQSQTDDFGMPCCDHSPNSSMSPRINTRWANGNPTESFGNFRWRPSYLDGLTSVAIHNQRIALGLLWSPLRAVVAGA